MTSRATTCSREGADQLVGWLIGGAVDRHGRRTRALVTHATVPPRWQRLSSPRRSSPGRSRPPTATAVRTHQYQLRDAARDRPVWIDVWSPVPDAAAPATFPVIVMSHGAMGSARGHSRLASELAARGFVVAGVSHYRESWIYGPTTIDRAAVLRLWDRPPDLSFALDSLPQDPGARAAARPDARRRTRTFVRRQHRDRARRRSPRPRRLDGVLPEPRPRPGTAAATTRPARRPRTRRRRKPAPRIATRACARSSRSIPPRVRATARSRSPT